MTGSLHHEGLQGRVVGPRKACLGLGLGVSRSLGLGQLWEGRWVGTLWRPDQLSRWAWVQRRHLPGRLPPCPRLGPCSRQKPWNLLSLEGGQVCLPSQITSTCLRRAWGGVFHGPSPGLDPASPHSQLTHSFIHPAGSAFSQRRTYWWGWGRGPVRAARVCARGWEPTAETTLPAGHAAGAPAASPARERRTLALRLSPAG